MIGTHTVTVTDPDGKSVSVRVEADCPSDAALAAAETPGDLWRAVRQVDVSDVDGALAGFVVRQVEDDTDLELACPIGCTVDGIFPGNEMDTLVRACLDHDHGDEDNDGKH